MNWDQIKGNWAQFTGRIREEWGELTDDEVQEAKGDRDKLIGLIQEKYGKAREEAAEEVARFEQKLSEHT